MLTSKTARELSKFPKNMKTKRLLQNKDVFEFGERIGIISFNDELKEIMSDTTIKPDKYKLRDIRQLIPSYCRKHL